VRDQHNLAKNVRDQFFSPKNETLTFIFIIIETTS
jgi:hypothetical protein